MVGICTKVLAKQIFQAVADWMLYKDLHKENNLHIWKNAPRGPTYVQWALWGGSIIVVFTRTRTHTHTHTYSFSHTHTHTRTHSHTISWHLIMINLCQHNFLSHWHLSSHYYVVLPRLPRSRCLVSQNPHVMVSTIILELMYCDKRAAEFGNYIRKLSSFRKNQQLMIIFKYMYS